MVDRGASREEETTLDPFDALRRLGANWDSYGAPPLDPATVDRARMFLKRVHVCPCVRGGVQLEWHTHGIDLEIEFLPDGTVEMVAEASARPSQDAASESQGEGARWEPALAPLPGAAATFVPEDQRTRCVDSPSDQHGYECVLCGHRLEASARPAPQPKAETKCRYCGEEIRFIDGDWIDSETYSICIDGRKHAPTALADLRTEIGTVLRQVEITESRAANAAFGREAPVTAEDWHERVTWLVSVLKQTWDAMEREHLAHLRAAATARPAPPLDWQPIETAPYATFVLAWLYLPKNPPASGPVIAQRCYVQQDDPDTYPEAQRQTVGCWWANGMYYTAGHVTHWMPLPAPPLETHDDA